MRITNKSFARRFLQHSQDIIEEAGLINPDDKSARNQIAIAEIKNAAVKQANNTFRACLQHDVSKAKLQNYKSSFLEEELLEGEEE